MIGQIVYKLQLDNNREITYPTSVWIPTDNLVEKVIGVPEITAVGIQAPYKTQFQINGNDFVVGRNGIYQISDVSIKSLNFLNADLKNIIIDYQY